ncbi:phosphotransferase enzyme family protein [Cupriavidus sp. BIC8F]|uniref:phosphotransferase enzyme family protein n=1 Tax=Cupriavidus sp. BIC8F TaxID=3079014 RepID=UPI002916DFF4|nr:phosphotransferase [Cupriavidus sp. BIC8F]
MTTDHESKSAGDIALVRRAVATVYGIDAIDVHEVVRGVNRTFSLTDSADRTYYLRLYRTHGRDEVEIDAELHLLARIERDDLLEVSSAHSTLRGGRRFRLALSDGAIRHAALFDAAVGRPLEMTCDDFAAAANALKRLHAQPALGELAPSRHIAELGEAYRTLNRLAEAFAFAGSAAATVRDRCKHLAAAGWPPAGMPIGFCHGDFRVANMRIEGRRVTLFDFDDCGCGPQWFDLATIGWWLETEGRDDSASLWRAFVNAYMPALYGSPGFFHAISVLILLNEIRSIGFLLDYCVLDEPTWREMCRRLDDLSYRAVSGQLAIDRWSA